MSTDDNDMMEVPAGAEDEKSKDGDDDNQPVLKYGRVYVAKNSLVEEELIKARDAARARVQGKKREDATQQEKYEDRRAANRLASFQSRKRRKGNIDELEKTVAQLEAAGEDQHKEIEDQRERLQTVQMENERLRQQLAVAGSDQQSSTATATSETQRQQQQSSDAHHAFVYDMSSKLNQLQAEHRATRQAQENRHAQDKETLKARRSQQQQHLLSTQSEQLKQLDNDHLEEQRQLTKKHDDEALHFTSLLGLHGHVGSIDGNSAVADSPRQQQQQQKTVTSSMSHNNQDSDTTDPPATVAVSTKQGDQQNNNPTDSSSSAHGAAAVSETSVAQNINTSPTGAAVAAAAAAAQAQVLNLFRLYVEQQQKFR